MNVGLRGCNCLDFKITSPIVQVHIEFGSEHYKLFEQIQGNILYKANIVNIEFKDLKVIDFS